LPMTCAVVDHSLAVFHDPRRGFCHRPKNIDAVCCEQRRDCEGRPGYDLTPVAGNRIQLPVEWAEALSLGYSV
jgi:hypothetical protein